MILKKVSARWNAWIILFLILFSTFSISIEKVSADDGVTFPPFVVDVRSLSRFAGNGNGTAYFNIGLNPTCIVLHQTATGNWSAGLDKAIDGLIIINVAQLNTEKTSWYDGALYHFIISDDAAYSLSGNSYATTQWLVSPTAVAYHALDYNYHCVGISFVDHVKGGPMQPAQENSMFELSRNLVGAFNIDPCRVWGHTELDPSRRSDPVGVNLAEFRQKLGCPAQQAMNPNYSIDGSVAYSGGNPRLSASGYNPAEMMDFKLPESDATLSYVPDVDSQPAVVQQPQAQSQDPQSPSTVTIRIKKIKLGPFWQENKILVLGGFGVLAMSLLTALVVSMSFPSTEGGND